MGLAAYFEQLVKGGVDLGVASSLAANKDNPGITPQRVRDWLERYPDLQPYIEAIVAFERVGIDPGCLRSLASRVRAAVSAHTASRDRLLVAGGLPDSG